MEQISTGHLMEELKDVKEAELEAFSRTHARTLPSLGDYWGGDHRRPAPEPAGDHTPGGFSGEIRL
ncbi:MAG: hypothetical protein LUH36_06720 [Oscillospiraceae bacterium]|nr:hypothetical protein [Oscillospiraceae bacterium]